MKSERIKKLAYVLVIAAATLGPAGPALADDLSGAKTLLCSTSTAVVCVVEGECEKGPAWTWNIPEFVEIDLEAKTLRTTEASGERRMTPAEIVRRDEGLIFLQGMENGRAFSLVISEAIGSLSTAIVREDLSITVFGNCTPARAAD
jgi:hypothetical protein